MSAYEASPIKRGRATQSEMSKREALVLEIVAEMQPMSVRQVFYQASVRGDVEKSEAGYAKIQRCLVDLRRSGRLAYDWIADNTRWQRKPETFADPKEAVLDIARFYRKSLWIDAEDYVEVWLEKDALASVVVGVTDDFD